MTIKNEEIISESFNALNRNEYQGHIAWCLNKTENGNCYGVNFLTLKSLDIKWVSRILNAPTFNYSCGWCGETKRFDSIMFMNGELTPSFYGDFKLGNIDKCVSFISKFLNSSQYIVNKKTLKELLIELYNHEESLNED